MHFPIKKPRLVKKFNIKTDLRRIIPEFGVYWKGACHRFKSMLLSYIGSATGLGGVRGLSMIDTLAARRQQHKATAVRSTEKRLYNSSDKASIFTHPTGKCSKLTPLSWFLRFADRVRLCDLLGKPYKHIG